MNVTLGVEEFQGLYGPYQVSELVLQKIWLKGAFDGSRIVDPRGRPVEVIFPGRWNRLAGPDFKDAVLLIGGERVEGDVEIHFAVGDWKGHGHQENPNFDRVALHVVYHPIREGEYEAKTHSGKTVPAVSLMDLLWYDLEEYASEDSIVESTGAANEEAIEKLFEHSIEERRACLIERAAERWEGKRRFAQLRIDRLGWSEACHQTALEIMGYAANRIPMLRVAGSYPLERFASETLPTTALWEVGRDDWTTSGVRPANHPKIRLEQYIAWVAARPDWPEMLVEFGRELPAGPVDGNSTAAYRKSNRISNLQRRFYDKVAGGQVSGSKLDTLVCDGFLPLLAARESVDLSGLWFHWYAGNTPENIGRSLKNLGVLEAGRFPLSNGWVQGLLKLRQSIA